MADAPRAQPTRRALLGALALGIVPVAAVLAPQANAAVPERVATIDWAVLETLLALGVVPVAAAELTGFRRVAVEPAVPTSVADIGLRGLPSYEALRLARPDLILSSNFYSQMEARLRLVAPVETLTVFSPGEDAFEIAVRLTRALGDRLGRSDAARQLIETVRSEISGYAAALSGETRPFILINLGDARHFRVFGRDSVFGRVLELMRLANAWTVPTSYAATAPIGLERLAQFPDAWIVIVPPVPPDALAVLAGSAFWQALPGVAAGRVLRIDTINPFGALPSARRFARQFAATLKRAREGAHG